MKTHETDSRALARVENVRVLVAGDGGFSRRRDAVPGERGDGVAHLLFAVAPRGAHGGNAHASLASDALRGDSRKYKNGSFLATERAAALLKIAFLRRRAAGDAVAPRQTRGALAVQLLRAPDDCVGPRARRGRGVVPPGCGELQDGHHAGALRDDS